MFRFVVTCAALALAATQSRGSLLAHWTFDEPSGTVAHDSAGSIDGVLNSGASFAPGQGIAGGAVSIDRTNNGLVNFGDHFSFATGSFSVVAWVKSAPGDTNALIPLSKHNAGFQNGYFLGVNDVGDGFSSVTHAHLYASTTASGNSPAVVNDGNWHQLIGVYDTSANTTSIYVDGGAVSTGSLGPIIANDAPFIVGGVRGFNAGDPLTYYSGLIDDVRLYDNALSASDAQALYLSVVPEPATLAVLAMVIPVAFLRRGGRRQSR